MLSSSLGAAPAGAIQPAVPVQKHENNEEFSQPVEAQRDAPVAAETKAAVVPPTSGGAISLEAVTALQQADDSAANNNEASSVKFPLPGVDGPATAEQVAVTTGAEDPVIEAESTDRQESRQSSSTEVAVGEETDGAGRSVRNPLDLQI